MPIDKHQKATVITEEYLVGYGLLNGDGIKAHGVILTLQKSDAAVLLLKNRTS